MQPARHSTSSISSDIFPSPRSSTFYRDSISLSLSFRRSSYAVSIHAQKITPHSPSISNLLEYTYVPKDAQIDPTNQSLLCL